MRRLAAAAPSGKVDSNAASADPHTIMTPIKALALAALIAALAACGSTGNEPLQSAGASAPKAMAQPVRLPSRYRPRNAVVQALPGAEGVIGATSADLLRQFGTPRLDVWEADARKLQFTGTSCVLDVYLYPLDARGEPRATYVDARRATDGKDVDRAACIAALRKR